MLHVSRTISHARRPARTLSKMRVRSRGAVGLPVTDAIAALICASDKIFARLVIFISCCGDCCGDGGTSTIIAGHFGQ